MPTYRTPGVYREDVFLETPAGARSGVPAFLGYAGAPNASAGAADVQQLTQWEQWPAVFGTPPSNTYLAYAVRGFFENGGSLCYIVRLDPGAHAIPVLAAGLAELLTLDTIDLVCAPDIMRQRGDTALPPDPAEVAAMQALVLEHCAATGDRFALLDSLPGLDPLGVIAQRQRVGTSLLAVAAGSSNAALYYPWLRVTADALLPAALVPPCGHIAGTYARSDRRSGVHKAPANESLEGVVDLERDVSDAQQAELNPAGINCVRAFPGRGIRTWGARTLSNEAAWAYVNVRRLFLTAVRWIEQNMTGVVFEPNDVRLWARIGRELTAYCNDLFRQGALHGNTPAEAFFVKCDAETNPAEVRAAGQVVTEIGLAPGIPNEFIVVRIVHGGGGVTITAPATPAMMNP